MNPTPALAPVLTDLHGAAERIWHRCERDWPTLSVDVLPEVDSTNTRLMAQGRAGLTEPTLQIAVSQTAGRGRHGRTWHSQPGASLTFSLGLPLRLDDIPGGGSALSLAVGLSIAQSIEQGLLHTSADGAGSWHRPIGLKWPNDLWIRDRKLGGILIEATPAPSLPEHHRWVVIGVGLNVRSEGLPPGAIALQAAMPPACQVSVGTLWEWIAPALLRDVRQFEHTGFAPLQAAFASRDVLLGRPIGLRRNPPPEETASGVSHGVDESGALLVHTAAGAQRWITGEVSVRPC